MASSEFLQFLSQTLEMLWGIKKLVSCQSGLVWRWVTLQWVFRCSVQSEVKKSSLSEVRFNPLGWDLMSHQCDDYSLLDTCTVLLLWIAMKMIVLGEGNLWFRILLFIQILALWPMDKKAEAEPKIAPAKYYQYLIYFISGGSRTGCDVTQST